MNVIRQDDKGYNPVFVDSYSRIPEAQLIDAWKTDIAPGDSMVVRDSIVEAMIRKGIRPQEWIHTRENQYGVYPDIDDPEFASLLYRKTEFASLASVMAPDSTCSQSKTYFDTTPVQRLVARFLHPTTPYNGILLNHGVGVGKTCSAITVAETFLEYMPTHTVFILAPQAIAEGFKNTIFDVDRLLPTTKEQYRLTGDKWTSPQCTGMTYLRLTGNTAESDKSIIAKDIDKLIRRRYAIMGYIAFANWVKRKLALAVPPTITGPAREVAENKFIIELFSDHLIIVDEAHNLRDDRSGVDKSGMDEVDASLVNDSAAGKALTPILKRIVEVSEGLRLMLMTATPMYNVASEIVFLLNLLLLNDTKDPKRLLKESDFFNTDGSFIATKKIELQKVAKRYVSYMRGENPNTFPIRLTPIDSDSEHLIETYPKKSPKRSEINIEMTDIQKNIFKALPIVTTRLSDDSFLGDFLRRKLISNLAVDRDDDERNNMIMTLIQNNNITYPNETTAGVGLNTYMKRSIVTVKGVKTVQYNWREKLEDGSESPTIDSVFGSGITRHAPKIGRIVDSITNGKGMAFVFSRFLAAGAIPTALAMEYRGYCRVLADGTPAPLLKRTAQVGGYKGYYILLTSDDELSPNFKGLLEYATTFSKPEEADGRKIKCIIGSAIASEGLDLKCIRQLHILDPWYHLNRIEQITGRGVRFCSHTLLRPEERNCLVYLHAVYVNEYETSDLYAYRLATRKAIPIGQVSRELKISAWDCMLNKEAIQFKSLPKRTIVDSLGRSLSESGEDRPFTSFCDYNDTCEYACLGTPLPDENIGKDISTATEYDYRRYFLQKQKILANIFYESEVAVPLEKIRDLVYGDIPASLATIGLREMLGTIRIKRKDGLYGTLILMNDYIVFQPFAVTDTQIPVALRYGRAYGRLPRTMEPSRGSLLTYSAVVAPVEEETLVPAPIVEVPASYKEALSSLQDWKRILTQIITQPTGIITRPTSFKDPVFLGIRWVYTRFATLDETMSIGLKWWMDNVWTSKERSAVCSEFVRRGVNTLSGDENTYAKLLGPVELFTGDINGYHEYKAEKLITNCLIEGESTVGECPSSFQPIILSQIGAPVNREKDTDDIFGMLVLKGGTTIFKTVDKTASKVLKLEGAECANQSNLVNHWARLRNIQNKIRNTFGADSDIGKLLLDDNPELNLNDIKERASIQEEEMKLFNTPTKEPSKRITHISHLNLKQICPYLEFLLRYAEMKRMGGKRWFLGLIDAIRAGAKMSE